MDWYKIGKGVYQVRVLSLYLFNFYAEHILQNAGLDDSQAGIKITRRNINKLSYAYDTILIVESEEELKEHLGEGERGEWKSWLKTQHSKSKDHGIQSHHFMANRGGKVEAVTDFILLGSKITADDDCSHEIKDAYSLEGKL